MNTAGSPRATVLPLQWGCDVTSILMRQSTMPFDFVIGSDICYDPDQFMQLIQTIHAVEGATVNPKTFLGGHDLNHENYT